MYFYLYFKNYKMPTHIYSNLSHAVSFTKCSSMRYFQSIKIYGDAKWYCNFICPCVSTSDTTRRIVDFMRNVYFSEIPSCVWKTMLKLVFFLKFINFEKLEYIHSCFTNGTNSLLLLSGNTEHFKGATIGGKLK